MGTKIKTEKAGKSGRLRGRPPGQTARGADMQRHLYATAISLISRKGYQQTTLREIATQAGVSPGLLYRYFPNKRAVVLALYEELSAQYAERALAMPRGTWPQRFVFALGESLAVLGPHRNTLSALLPVLIADPDQSLFANPTAFSRRRVQQAFSDAVSGADNPPSPDIAPALGRLLYLVHMAIILWWLLDRSHHQRATTDLLAMIERTLPVAAPAMNLPMASHFIAAADALVRDALLRS